MSILSAVTASRGGLDGEHENQQPRAVHQELLPALPPQTRYFQLPAPAKPQKSTLVMRSVSEDFVKRRLNSQGSSQSILRPAEAPVAETVARWTQGLPGSDSAMLHEGHFLFLF